MVIEKYISLQHCTARGDCCNTQKKTRTRQNVDQSNINFNGMSTMVHAQTKEGKVPDGNHQSQIQQRTLTCY
jgi:hypothetical protein